MNRSALAAALLCSSLIASPVLAQAAKGTAKPATGQAKSSAAKPAVATPATPTTTAPAAPAKFTPPIKGIGKIQVIQSPSQLVGNEIITKLKVKNVSDGPIALLRADQLWYSKTRSADQISGDSYSHKRPFQPGEVIEITFHAPMPAKDKGPVGNSQYMFSHVNGKIEAKGVKKFEQ